MEDQTLFMLCDPKKCKKIEQNNMDVYINSYDLHSNELNKSESPKSDSSSEIIEDTSIPDYMTNVIEHINHIDHFILNHNYDTNMEKINDYLVDLLFLIKSKKNKK